MRRSALLVAIVLASVPVPAHGGEQIWPGRQNGAGFGAYHVGDPTATPDPATSVVRLTDLNPGGAPCILQAPGSNGKPVCATPPTSLPPSGAAGGGLGGTYPNPTVTLAAGAAGYGSGSNTLTGDATNFHWDAADLRLGLRTSAPIAQLHFVDEAGAGDRGALIGTYFTGDTGPIIDLDKSNGSFASPSIVANTNYSGRIGFRLYDGSTFLRTAQVGTHVIPGTSPTAGNAPTMLYAYVSPTGATDPFGSVSKLNIQSQSTGGVPTTGFGLATNVAPGFGVDVNTTFGGGHDGLPSGAQYRFVPGSGTYAGLYSLRVSGTANSSQITGAQDGLYPIEAINDSSLNNQLPRVVVIDLNPAGNAGFLATNFAQTSVYFGVLGASSGGVTDGGDAIVQIVNTSGGTGVHIGDVLFSNNNGLTTLSQMRLAGDGGLNFYNTSAAVSLSGASALRSNGNALQYSENGGAWTSLDSLSNDHKVSITSSDGTSDYLAAKVSAVSPIVLATVSASAVPTTGMKLWLKADTGVTTSGSNVTAWADQSGSGNNVAVGAASPVLATNILNGLPAINFTGSTQELVNSSTNLVSAGAARTVIAVVKSSNATGGAIMSFKLGTPEFATLLFKSGSTTFAYSDGVSVNATFTSPPTISGVPYAVEFYSAGTGNALAVDLNGAAQTLGTPTVTSDSSGSTGFIVGNRRGAGAGQFFQGFIMEVMVWDHVLSGSDAAVVRTYLAGRYALTIAGATAPQTLQVAGRGLYVSGDTTTTPQDLSALTTGLAKMTVSGGKNVFSTASAGTDFQAPGNYVTAGTGPVTFAGPGSSATSINFGGGGISGTLALANEGSPTGSGFAHVTGGAWDSAARAVNLASGDVINLLPAANVAPSGTNSWVLTTVGGVAVWQAPAAPGVGTVTSVSCTGGDCTIASPTSTPVISLANVGPGAVTTGGAGIASITTDAQGRMVTAATANYQLALSFPANDEVLGSTGSGVQGSANFTYNFGSDVMAAGDAVGINGVSIPTNAYLVGGHTTASSRDRAQFYVGGGTLGPTGTGDGSFVEIIPTSTAIRGGVTGGIYSTLRVGTATYTGTGQTISEANGGYFEAPSLTTVSGPVYAIHGVGGPSRFSGGTLVVDNFGGFGTVPVVTDNSGNLSPSSLTDYSTSELTYYVEFTPTMAGSLNASPQYVATTTSAILYGATPNLEYPTAGTLPSYFKTSVCIVGANTITGGGIDIVPTDGGIGGIVATLTSSTTGCSANPTNNFGATVNDSIGLRLHSNTGLGGTVILGGILRFTVKIKMSPVSTF